VGRILESLIVSAQPHAVRDPVSLEIARRVSRRLREYPGLLEVARANLARWTERNADTPSLLRCYAEWEELLSHPLNEICDPMCAATADAHRLRQNSPFACVLPPAEICSIEEHYSRFPHAPTPA
jgi:hypothetical protein